MCLRCMTVRRVCFERSSGLEVGEETQSQVNYVFSGSLVGRAQA